MAGAAAAGVLYATQVSSAANTASSPSDVKDKAHHSKDGKGFSNPWDSFSPMSAPTILGTMITRRFTGAYKPPYTPGSAVVPVQKPSFSSTRDTPSLRATWLGHAAYLVEFPSGFRVLFDPVFSDRCSPFSWMGPKRYTEVPCEIDDVPFIDAVVISHNHYDHMDHPTITKIIQRHPNVHFFVPLKNKELFTAFKINPEQVTELDWWDQRDIKLVPDAKSSKSASSEGNEANSLSQDIKATIGCLPAQHGSARGPFDRDHSLWASWSVESGGKKVFFGGDTGYRSVPLLPTDVDDYDEEHNYPHCPAFKQIGDLRGPFDLGLIPIGAYSPRHLFSPVHANPFDSVNIFKDTKCSKAMAIHWGTWVLTEEPILEPPKLLREALKRSGIAEEGVFDICDIGESREFV